jgi:hypothetical protein
MDRKLARLEKRFHRIASQLTRFDLQKLGSSDGEGLPIDDVVSDLQEHPGSSLFMGYYTHSGLMEVLKRYGITKLLKDKGFSDLHLRMQTADPFHHMLQLYGGTEPDPARLLIEIVLHEVALTPKGERTGEPSNMVLIEWLCLQNPLGEFQPAKPRLPGQQRPGLGISLEVAGLLVMMTERLGKDGLVNIPRYYHTGQGAHRRGFSFVDPETEGVMMALERDLRGHSLADASWVIDLGLVSREGSSEPFSWVGEEQVLAISDRTKGWFDSRDYRHRCLQAEQSVRFAVDWKAYEKMRLDPRVPNMTT